MSIRGKTIACVLVIWVAVQARGQTTSVARPDKPEAGVAYADLYLPGAIGDSACVRWKDDLQLDVLQRDSFDAFFRAYLEQDQALRASALPDLWKMSKRVGSSANSEGLPEMMRAREEFLAKMRRVEADFFSSIEAMLGPHQQPLLPRVRRHRDRASARVVSVQFPGAAEDLSLILHEIQIEAAFESDDPHALAALLEQYEATMTPLFRELERATIDKINLEHRLFVKEAARGEDAQTIMDRFTTSNVVLLRSGEALFDVNQRFLRQFSDVLPPWTFATLEDRYNRLAFPQVYPDPFDASPVFDCFLTQAEGDPSHAAIVPMARAEYQVQQRRLSSDLQARHVERQRAWLKHRTRDIDAFNAYKKDMLAMQRARAELAVDAIARATALLQPIGPDCQRAIDAHQRAIASHRPRESGFSFRP